MCLQSSPKPEPPAKDPAFRKWIRTHPCVVPGCPAWDIQCCHVRVKRYGPDVGNCVPLCKLHHDEQHKGIKTFQRKYGIDLPAIAKQLGDEYTGKEWAA